jgi:hypothetical protein
MIKHAWTVLCDKTITDRETNNISLDAIEEVRFALPAPPADAEGILVPYRHEIVSLWYRSDPALPERGRTRMRTFAPGGEPVIGAEAEIDLVATPRLRTMSRFPGLPVPRSASSGGRYWYVVELEQDGRWLEVARVPFEVAVTMTP